MRLSALIQIAKHVKEIDYHNTVYMDEGSYNHLEEIAEKIQNQVQRDKSGFYERNCRVHVTGKGEKI